MKKLRDAVLSKGVSASKLQAESKEILPDSVFDELRSIGGGGDEPEGEGSAFGKVFGKIPF